MSIELTSKTALAALLVVGLVLAQPLGQSLAWAQDDAVETESEAEAVPDDQSEDVVLDDEGEDVALGEEDEEETDIGAPLGLTILGVATLAGGVGYFLASSDDESLAGSVAADDPDYQQDLLDRSDREKVVAITLTSLSVALLGTATYLWITLNWDEDDEVEDLEVSFAPSISLDGAGFLLHGRF